MASVSILELTTQQTPTAPSLARGTDGVLPKAGHLLTHCQNSILQDKGQGAFQGFRMDIKNVYGILLSLSHPQCITPSAL